ncbi:hypothetical protein I5M27_12785 [Adhaeribacter sp. BT258]|uniref:DUF2158 domain-containing protein n=1 Tax=Adhaeribacter terrigena TaxID=2793070 RepID=A0ABS1C3H4_9BACT|nr:hypothetical protein [Adhaeribacter terrigena]MBK0403868.1 hypothetical protein [Adhaeribacter terrigena]
MQAEIKTGTKVRLVTGGPVMTVKAIENNLALCEWLVVGRNCSMHFKVKNLVAEEAVKTS